MVGLAEVLSGHHLLPQAPEHDQELEPCRVQEQCRDREKDSGTRSLNLANIRRSALFSRHRRRWRRGPGRSAPRRHRKPAKGLINNMRRQRQSWPSALVRRLLNCPSAPRAQASGPFDMRGIRAAPFGKLARSRRPDSGYPGDTALSRLIGAPDAHQRDMGAANCRASCCARFSWRGRRGGRLRGRAHRAGQPGRSPSASGAASFFSTS